MPVVAVAVVVVVFSLRYEYAYAYANRTDLINSAIKLSDFKSQLFFLSRKRYGDVRVAAFDNGSLLSAHSSV